MGNERHSINNDTENLNPAQVCLDALTAVRLDPSWHIHLEKETKDLVSNAIRLIGGE